MNYASIYWNKINKKVFFKSLFVTTSLCFISISSHGEGWYPLTRDVDYTHFVQIISHPSQDNPYPKAWWWMIWRDKKELRDGTILDNGKILLELDCQNHRVRQLHCAFYDGEELIASSPVKAHWETVLPDSNVDQFIKLVCDKSERSLLKPIEVDTKQELSFLRDKRGQQAIKQSLAKSKWFLVYRINYKDNKIINVFDKNSLRIKGPYRQILNWTVGTNPSSEEPLAITKSTGSLEEYDCNRQRNRILKMFAFSKTKTEQLIILSGASAWQLIRKNTLGYNDFCVVCQNKFTGIPFTVDFSTIKTIPEEWLAGSDE